MAARPPDWPTDVDGMDSWQFRWKRRWSGGLWHVLMGAYVTVLCTATHLPKPPMDLLPIRHDKTLHFLVYFGFGLILGLKPIWSLRKLAVAWCLLLVFAAADELTQPFFRRSAEWSDWTADAVGGAGGLLVAALLVRSIAAIVSLGTILPTSRAHTIVQPAK